MREEHGKQPNVDENRSRKTDFQTINKASVITLLIIIMTFGAIVYDISIAKPSINKSLDNIQYRLDDVDRKLEEITTMLDQNSFFRIRQSITSNVCSEIDSISSRDQHRRYLSKLED